MIKLRYPFAGAVVLTAAIGMSQFSSDAAVTSSANVCSLNERGVLQIRDTVTGDVKARLDKITGLKDETVSGPGTIYAGPDHTIKTGIIFSASADGTCKAQHQHAPGNADAVIGRMDEKARNAQLAFTVK